MSVVEIYHRQRPLVRVALFGALIFVMGMGYNATLTEIIMHRLGRQWWEKEIISNILISLTFSWIAHLLIQARDKRIKKRFDEIAYLNHHVRNALHQIVLANGTNVADRCDLITEASTRIQRCVEHLSRDDTRPRDGIQSRTMKL